MAAIKYHKLVRDLIPRIIEKSGKQAVVKIVVQDHEYIAYLEQKLAEELEEYWESLDIEELADIQEVIYALVEAKGLSVEEFETLRLKKRQERGGFVKRIVLLEVTDE